MPAWQVENGIPTDFSTLALEEKLMWAWRGQETLLYGTFAMYASPELLNEPRYRFDAHTAQDLEDFRILFLESRSGKSSSGAPIPTPCSI